MGNTDGRQKNIAIDQGMEGLERLREEWVDLFNSIEEPAYYQDWRWMAALQSWLIDADIYFLSLRKQGRIRLILPLQVRFETRAGMSHCFVSFPSHNHIVLSDSLIDARYIDEGDMAELIDYLVSQKVFKWSFLEVSGLCENSDLYKLLQASDVKFELKSYSAYFDWSDGEYDKTLSKKFIKNIRRLGNRAEVEKGPVVAEFISAADELTAAYDIFLDLEASGWKGETGTSTAIKHNENLVAFYGQLLMAFARDGSFQINILRVNGQPAAAQLCIKSGSTWYVLKVAYLESLKAYGVGNLLMLHFLERSSEEPETTEVCLVTSPVWADRWHLKKRTVHMMSYYNSNLKGRLTKVVKNTKKKLKVFIR